MTDRLLCGNPTEFFRGLLREALDEQRVEPSQDAEFYLVTLLERFVRPGPDWFDRPLALTYLEAAGAEPPERYRNLKHVGDTALFVTGVFHESLETKTVGPEYYATLGGLAYRRLAASPGTPAGKSVIELFTEMSVRFLDFVRVLSQMSLADVFGSDRETLRIYRRWLVTRGPRDAERLLRRGVIPFAPRKPKLQ
jgi:hypothetical protein